MMISLTVSVRTDSDTDSVDVTGDEAFLEAFNSARIVASTLLSASLEERGVTVETDHNASLVGRSGGAALALLMTCAINGTVPREGTTVSAGVRPDGSLMGVAQLPSKCAAVLDAGLRELWVAEENAQVVTWEERQDPVTGQVRLVQRDLPVAEACPGIRVRTVGNISDLAQGVLSPPRQEP
jgi:predicted S18 family serine protease